MFGLVALAANAAHADPGLVAAQRRTTSVADPAEWIGYECPPASAHLPPPARVVRAELVGRLLEAADRYPSTGYHGRAVGLYREVLKYWTPETILLAGEYLWMATEALSRGIVEADAASRGITPKNLGQLHRAGTTDVLYARARADGIFPGEAPILTALQEASDGFEHGFMPLPDVRDRTAPILETAAKCVRHALINVLGLAAADEAALLIPEWDAPLGLVPPMHVMRGKLQVADEGALAPVALDEPVEMIWEAVTAPQIERDEKGKLNYTRRKTVTVAVGPPPGVELGSLSSGIRASGATAYKVTDLEITRAAGRGADTTLPVGDAREDQADP